MKKTMFSIQTDILFIGFCPGCALKGNENQGMRLNSMDFWECKQCHLQLTTFPPLAAILRWRGDGHYKSDEMFAVDHFKDLLLTKACRKTGQEIFPNEKELLTDSFDLEEYILSIYDSEKAFQASKLKMDDPALIEQENYLQSIACEEWENLIALYQVAKKEGVQSSDFEQLHECLYDLKVVFPFNWPGWDEGLEMLDNGTIDYASFSLLQVSMYLTLICRSDRFNDVSLTRAFTNGTLDQLFKQMEQIT